MNLPRIYARIDTQPTRSMRLQLAATWLAASLAGAAWLHWHMHEAQAAQSLLTFGCTLSIAATLPVVGRVLYMAWMAFGLTLGWITSPLILGGVYFGVITPIALLLRLFGRDAMQKNLAPQAQSYWQRYPEHDDPARYLGQF